MADIRALELDFAKNPTLDTCIPLCEAYLQGKRYMEAMVVCKKGIKQAPQDARGRVLLARVYVDQGKLPKAEQEVIGALKDFPGNPFASELMGQILVQLGRNQEAVPFLQQALNAAPNLPGARSLLQQLGVASPQAAQPTPQQRPPQQPGMQPVQPGMRPMQPGMQPMQPGMRPMQPGMPPMQPGMPPMQPGMPPMQPGMPPMQPGMPPGAPMMPGQAPPQTPWATDTATPTAPPKQQGPKLEHVSDFFAEDTLGFESDGSHIETAGPGRLTILGFVPKTTGSIKTTIIVALALFAVASVVVVWQYVSSKNTREIAGLYGQMKSALDEDKLPKYHYALKIGQEIFKIDADHNQTLSAMAYAEAVLGNDHQEDGAIDRAKAYLQRAIATGEQHTEYRVAAAALLAFNAGELDRGIAEVKKVQDDGGSATLIEVEMLRLRDKASPNDKETIRQLQRVN
ncbi:MAG: tetratricopeptide repeat protein, partial [Pseudomonadota bacterium]